MDIRRLSTALHTLMGVLLVAVAVLATSTLLTQSALEGSRVAQYCAYLLLTALALLLPTVAWIFVVTQRRIKELSREIGVRRRAEAKTTRLTSFYQALSRTGHLIGTEHDAQRLFEGVCRTCVETGHANVTFIVTVENGLAVPKAAAGLPSAVESLPTHWDLAQQDVLRTVFGQALTRAEHAIGQDMPGDTGEAPLPRPWQPDGAGSCAAFPLRRRGSVVGVLVLYTVEAGFFDDAVVVLLDAMASDLSLALDNIDREAARVSAAREAEADRAAFQRVFAATPAFASLTALDDTRIVAVNDVVCERYGYAREEMIGRRWTELGVGLSQAERSLVYEQLMSRGTVRDVEGTVRLRSGAYVDVLLNAERVEFAGRSCALLIALDISSLHEAEQARHARLAAEAANRAKTDFLSRMSHELRTPLNAVLGFSQLLQTSARDRLTQAQLAQLGHIRDAGWHLLMLINDVLDVSRIEAGHLLVEVRPTALLPLLDEALLMSEGLASKYGTFVGAAYRNAAPIGVSADPNRLRQVLLNLLSNAIKYNRPGGSVHVESVATGGEVSITVADTGLGMTREQLEHLYEPFNRLGRERGGIEGTGIGLALTRQIVALMDGRMEVDSEIGRGTRVRVTLPACEPPPLSEPPSMISKSAADASPTGVVLYIEDNPVNMMLVEQVLSSWNGVRLIQAEDGARGIEMARAVHPDLVLLDMKLPDMSGIQVLQVLQRDAATRGLRVVALSASAMPEEVAAARQYGACDYWTKPLDFDRFLADLRRLLRRDAISS